MVLGVLRFIVALSKKSHKAFSLCFHHSIFFIINEDEMRKMWNLSEKEEQEGKERKGRE